MSGLPPDGGARSAGCAFAPPAGIGPLARFRVIYQGSKAGKSRHGPTCRSASKPCQSLLQFFLFCCKMALRDTEAIGRVQGSTSPPHPYAGAHTSHTADYCATTPLYPFYRYFSRGGIVCVASGGVGIKCPAPLLCLDGQTLWGPGMASTTPTGLLPLRSQNFR